MTFVSCYSDNIFLFFDNFFPKSNEMQLKKLSNFFSVPIICVVFLDIDFPIVA